MTRGRKPKLSVWLDVLSRLHSYSLVEIRREGPYSAGQLRHYVREMVRRGLIEPARYFSHLPTDGPGAKRYTLTARGRATVREIQERVAENEPGAAVSQFKPPPKKSSARVTNPRGPISSQRFANAHNICFSMLIEEPFSRPFGWDLTYKMGPRSDPKWHKRHATFGKGIHIEESGGTIADEAGAAGHKLTIKFSEQRRLGENPSDVDRRAWDRVMGLRETIQMRFGCRLSDPVPVGHWKHSFPHDPVARSIRAKGIALHGPIGVDDTPEPDTLEIEDAKVADAYLKLPETLERLEKVNGRLLVAIESMARSQESVLTAQGQMLRQLEEIRRREPTGPTASHRGEN
jgi:hypothetical protein